MILQIELDDKTGDDPPWADGDTAQHSTAQHSTAQRVVRCSVAACRVVLHRVESYRVESYRVVSLRGGSRRVVSGDVSGVPHKKMTECFSLSLSLSLALYLFLSHTRSFPLPCPCRCAAVCRLNSMVAPVPQGLLNPRGQAPESSHGVHPQRVHPTKQSPVNSNVEVWIIFTSMNIGHRMQNHLDR